MTNSDYTPPVSQLLTYGEHGSWTVDTWPDYPKDFGLTAEHIPELLRLMSDWELWERDSESTEVWASCHAWRALAQLEAVEMVEPLLDLYTDYDYDDYINEETPKVLALLGPQILPRIEPYLKDPEFSPWGKIALIEAIKNIGLQSPESQSTCLELIRQQLENHKANDDSVNGWLVETLVKFQAVETAPLIEAVYASDNIDEMCAGTWPRVQVNLGLKQESDFDPDDFVPDWIREMRQDMALEQQVNNAIDSVLPKNPAGTAMSTGMTSALPRPRSQTPYKFGETDLNFSKSSSTAKKAGFGSGSAKSKKKKKKKK